MLKIGDQAPAFTILNQNNEKISLTNFLGQWVVLYFYPKDNTPGCTVEACTFSDNLNEFKKLKAVILGVSADSTQSHRKFIEKKNLKIMLLSDEDHKVLKNYEAWGEKSLYGKIFFGIIRSTFLIDPQGKIAHIWRKVKPSGHTQEIQKILKNLTKE
ncbi:MAG: bacterioferritin comigratory protein, peroxiredoxin Q/BCP [Candidatus Peregrinibacteria bacterium GW2011_GWF2_33_10]|nr:MAG: bacterioferritin comigratory protein, peroxiredoxin Q/BCP [Candidatus Peregrinibacteria bacterium GW2011_GWF2_33_10]OGJ44568.1 MAG: hypothetical protein A2263_02550 [Candidatus Peregrinibacteria bacterium RIFOXYA2_FULL_33_21]OGJ44874.1 MAG: hypothetical protein A2272_01860 [Candidatus Peregrinibacteria bacterium RIFOXYA12_FULL_33_12]OGJ50045.1 MAG: hypothetical protein A2307_01430 [Candidatus Peregrinibacteria bacterium RIFOXYB2_FULL_33_20]